MSKNISYLSGRKGLENGLFDRLNSQVTELADQEAVKKLAEEFLIGQANIKGALSFYDFLRKDSGAGFPVKICNGTACHLSGKQGKVRKTLETHFNGEEIGAVTCLGRCYENNAFQISDHNYSGNDIDQLDAIVKNKKAARQPGWYIKSCTSRNIFTGNLNYLNKLSKKLPNLLSHDSELLYNEIRDSGLRGRGGAGFPLHLKMNACRQKTAQQKYIVCNADEGDPGSWSDRYLLEARPELVLLGMMLSGYICGADIGVVYIRYEYPESVKIITEAIRKLEQEGLCGDENKASGFSFKFRVVKGAGSYICGEESALLSSIEGQRPEVRLRPPFPAESGLFNRPTLLSNVETFANIPFILLNGGKNFAAIGSAESSGTKLVCLDRHFKRPGLYEVEMGTTLSQLVYEYAGGFSHEVKALHIGGPLGGLVPRELIPDLNISFESFHAAGFDLGHASVISIPKSFPMIEYLHHLFEFAAHESCGKCFPCRIGSVRGKELLAKTISDSSYKIDSDLFSDLLNTLEKGSLCGLGTALPHPVKHALQYFQKELESNFTKPLNINLV